MDPRAYAQDLALVEACLGGDPLALERLDAQVIQRTAAAVRRVSPEPQFVADVLQQVRQRLLLGSNPRLGSYQGKGPLLAWVRSVAVRLALNALPSGRTEELDEASRLAKDCHPSAELGFLKARYGAEFERAFREALAGLPPEDGLVLRFHFVDGLNLEAIARLQRTSRATAGRRVLAARRRLEQETRRIVAERLRLDAPELDSLMRLLRSSLDLSLSGAVAA